MKPNQLFIIIDSLRSDRFYGENKSCITPNIDKLKKNGITFNQVISSADGTFLSLSSMLNSLHPSETGVRSRKVILHDENYLKQMKDFGYHIYGIVPKFTSLNSLMNYFENDDHMFEAEPPSAEYLHNGLGDKILDFFNSGKMIEPWFFFIHIHDLHWPLIVPKNFSQTDFGEMDYDRIISSIDPWIGKFVESVNLDKTLVTITADHGQLIPFDEKGIENFEPEFKSILKTGKKIMPKFSQNIGAKALGSLKKSIRDTRLKTANRNLSEYQKRSRLPYYTLSLFDESITVPLLFSGFGIEKGNNITQMIRTIDIFPTLAEIINLPKNPKKIHGSSLSQIIFEGKVIELETLLHTIPYEKESKDDKIGIRTSEWKYFRHARNSQEEIHLYDLKNDPHENQNIATVKPNIVKLMEEKISKILDNPLTSKSTMQDDLEEKKLIEDELKKMGYL